MGASDACTEHVAERAKCAVDENGDSAERQIFGVRAQIEADGKIHHGALQDRHQNVRRKLRTDLGPEIRSHSIRAITGLPQEHWSLHGEHESNIIYTTEAQVEAKKEEHTPPVLNAFEVSLKIEVDQNADE